MTIGELIKDLMPKKNRDWANNIGNCLYGKNHSWETVDTIEDILGIILTEISNIEIPEGMLNSVRKNIPSHLEPPDYETPLNRAFLVNKISEWYDKKFANETKIFKQVSVFDLIADFILDTKFGTPKENLVELDESQLSSDLGKFNIEYNGKSPHFQWCNFMAKQICSKFGHPKPSKEDL